MTIEELQVLITGETKQLRRELGNVKKQLGQAERDVKKSTAAISRAFAMIGATLATIGLGAAFNSAKKDAMAFEASLQQINRLMGESAGVFKQWSYTQASGFGFARSEAIRYGAVYANLISGFSRDTAELTQRTQDLLQASSVVASATGRSIEDVMERIRSGLLGNTEAIEDLGINVNVALIESTQAFQRFANGKSWDQLDFNIQQTIRYFAILEQAATKYGTEIAQNTTSNEAKFVAQLKDTRLALGQAFLPIYNIVLPSLTRMAAALASATRFLAAFSEALFGKSNQAKQTKETEAQAGAVGAVGDAYEKAGKQAKGAVAGFDQVNLIGGAAGADATGGIVPTDASEQTGALTEVASSIEEVSSKAQEMASRVKGAFSELKQAYGTLTQFIKSNSDIIISALAGVGTAIGTAFLISRWGAITGAVSTGIAAIKTAFAGIAAFIAGISWPIVAIVAAVGALVAGFVYFYRTNEEFKGLVDGILRAIGDAALWLWNDVLVPFGKWLGEVFVAAWGGVTVAAEWLWKNVLVPTGDFLLWFWDNVITPVGKALTNVLGAAFNVVADIAKSFWKNVLVPLGQFFKDIFGPTIEAVSAIFTYLWKEVLKPLGLFISQDMKPFWQDLATVIVFLLDDVLKPIVKFVGGALFTVFDNVFKSLGTIIDDLKTAFIGLMNFITGVFTGDWDKAWNGVKDIFGGVFGALEGLVKIPMNAIIDMINEVIKGLNKLKIDVPDWVGDIPGVPDNISSFGFSIPKIPRLDVGTNYVAKDGLAFLHEGEAVVPKAFNPAAGGSMGDNKEIATLLKSLIRAVQSGLNANVTIGRDAVGRASIDFIRSEQRRTGQLPFKP